MKKPAIVKIIDPFTEILTVEIENEEVMVPFNRVLPRDEKPATQSVKKRKQVVSKQASLQELVTPTTTPSPALPSLESYITPQFFLVVRPDGVEIGCGDLVTVAPTYKLAAKLRGEIRKAMTTKAARSCTLKIGPANLATDLELLSLTLESGFRTTKSKNNLADFDSLLGSNWDVKKKPDDHFFYVTYAEFALDVSTRALIMKIKFAESTCAFRPDSYRADTAADCC